MATTECDLLIIGGGPAGLSAAINGASEGMRVVLMDSGPELGGQARRSSLIENYPGFPDGISGANLLGHFITQAQKFQTDIMCPQTAVALRQDGAKLLATTDDEQLFCSSSVILSIGLSWRRLGVPGVSAFLGRGIRYGSPEIDPMTLGECTICILGAANSAGQAAMDLSRNPNAKIKILARRPIEDQMSQYLVDRIRGCGNIEVLVGVELAQVHGNGKLEGITLAKKSGGEENIPTDHLFIFIGAMPKTLWVKGTIGLDEKNFVLTGPKLVGNGWQQNRTPLPFETSVPGVFACGDVRVGSTKRVGAAVGEGTTALAMCHEFRRLMNRQH